jgi:hypothetical protein
LNIGLKKDERRGEGEKRDFEGWEDGRNGR